jgi:DNA polymerase-3 subunit beta
MKLELNLKKLKDAISMIERVAGKHMTLPVLSCVLIEVKNNTALFKATNLDIGIEVSVPVKSNEDGVMAVPASIISSFVSQVVGDSQLIKMDDSSGNLLITTAKSKGTIKTQAFDDFPSIPRVVDGKEFTIQPEAFLKGLKSVWYSSSISSVKPELSSVFVYKDESNLVFVATDSFRLAEKKIKIPNTANIGDILIPYKNIPDILRVLENINSNVTVLINKNLISFTSGEVYLVSRLIDGVFPDYRQIVPKSFVTEVVVLKQDIINALKVSNIFSDKFNQVHLSVDPKGKMFSIQTKNSDIGENSTTVDSALTGDPIEINFNYKYIADSFQSIDADSLTLQFSGNNRPMVIKPVSGDQTFMYLAMPMNR